MIEDAGTPARRAALLLYAMAPADRRWMLEQLPVDAGSELRRLLRELAELGIPCHRALLKQVVAEQPAAEAQQAALEYPDVDGFAALADAIAAAGPVRVAGALRDEPAPVIVMFLLAHDWTWREALLRHLDPLRARAVHAALADAGNAQRGWRAPGESQRLLLAAVQRRVPALAQRDPLEPAMAPSLPLTGSGPANPRRQWLKRLPGPHMNPEAR